MTEYEAKIYALALLRSQGLADWKFGVNDNRSRLGVCRHRHKTVEVSKFHLPDGLDAVRDTIGHEVAHAVVGPGHGHNHVWRAKALSLGSNGNRCGERMVNAPHRYSKVCKVHGVVGYMNRWSSRERSCIRCCRTFNRAFLLTLVENR